MERIIFSLLMLSALPCMAEIKDQPAAEAALNSASAKDRLDAISYLGAQRGDTAYAALAARFPDEKDAYLRVKIVEALDVAASTWAYNCAAAASADANKAVRASAAAAIAPLAGRTDADKALKALAKDPAETVRLELINSLSVRPSTSAVSIIGAALADKKGPARPRRAAAAALGNMGTAAAAEELVKHLSDQDPEVKAAAQKGRAALKKLRSK